MIYSINAGVQASLNFRNGFLKSCYLVSSHLLISCKEDSYCPAAGVKHNNTEILPSTQSYLSESDYDDDND